MDYRKASKHKFKPDISPVSRIIVEKKESEWGMSDSSQGSLSSRVANLPVYEKLYLSRNGSTEKLHSKQSTRSFESRSYSVADLKSYNTPMPQIREKRKDLPPTGKSMKKLPDFEEKTPTRTPSRTPRVTKSTNNLLF